MTLCITVQLADALYAMGTVYAMGALQCRSHDLQMPYSGTRLLPCKVTHLYVGRHAFMELYCGLVLKCQVNIPHQQHHESNCERHAEGQAHCLRSASILNP